MSEDKSQHDSMLTEKRLSQWEALMRKFSEAHKVQCKNISLDIPRAPRSKKQFPTGSQYEGTWDVLGMSGFGVYTFPNGVIYEGELEDGMFQGSGELRYPSGAILRGKWNKGHMTERTLIFADGLEYSEIDWKYCRMPDRRFTIEYDRGLQPAGKSYLTAEQPTRKIPPGYYDTGDGFYDPKTKVVYRADDMTAIIRVTVSRWRRPQEPPQLGIEARLEPPPGRDGGFADVGAGTQATTIAFGTRTKLDNTELSYIPDDAVGPRPDLYEEWTEPMVNPMPPPPPAAASRGQPKIYNPSSFELDGEIGRDDFFYKALLEISGRTDEDETEPQITIQNTIPDLTIISSDRDNK